MQVAEFREAPRLLPWKPSLRRAAHLTLEPTMTCNAAGPRCYKVDRSTVKALARILNSRGITCQVLTNRLRFLSAEGERAARTLGHTPRMAHAELKVGASRRWRVA